MKAAREVGDGVDEWERQRKLWWIILGVLVLLSMVVTLLARMLG